MIDLLIIGAGIVGLSIARQVILQKPQWQIALVDIKRRLGDGISGRNSGVIHGSLYYKPQSQKAQLCLRGNELTYGIANQLKIPHEKCGKLVVATNAQEEITLNEIFENARNIGAEVSLLSGSEIASKFPDLTAKAAILSHNTGIIDPPIYIKNLMIDLQQKGVMMSLDNGFESCVQISSDEIILQLNQEQISTQRVVTAAGLQEPEVVSGFGVTGYNIRPNKGEYYFVKKKIPLTHLIYPVPEENGLGIHLTKNVYDEIYAGPSAVWTDQLDDFSISTSAVDFSHSIQRYFPKIQVNDLQPGYVGIRPKTFYENSLLRDFLFLSQGENIIHLLGLESPGLTAAPAIGEHLVRNWLC